jgi:ankyrin repeat protein
VVEYLLSCGANPNDMNNGGNSSIIYACLDGYIDIVELLLDHGANIYHRTES